MVNDKNQEVEFKATSCKNNTKNKVKNQEKEEKFFVFLVYFQEQGEFFSFFKNPP